MSARGNDLLTFTERGIYCRKAGIFIDPSKGVPRAVVTHAHSDHARAGCQSYLSTPVTAALLKHRLGNHIKTQALPYSESLVINGVRFSFHPAGHIAGSAQVRVESDGEVWVVSGDYKREEDGVSTPFEVVRCNTFITESTFGLPVYQWPHARKEYEEINSWWSQNANNGVTSILTAYSLGKAQRLIQNLSEDIGEIYCHPAVSAINRTLSAVGVSVSRSNVLQENINSKDLSGALLIMPSSSLQGSWVKNIGTYVTGAASGWMTLRGRKLWQNVDRGFVISDHADWPALNSTIRETGCHRVIVTHGYQDIFAQWLSEQGYEASAESTVYEGDSE